MFISGDGDSYRSPILAATDEIGPREQLLFPFMNFTCSGNITRLIFVARRTHQLNNVTSWPVFSLWHHMGDDFIQIQRLGPITASVQPASRSMTGDSQEEVFMINFTPPIPFEPSYMLGVRQYYSLITQPDWYIKVLRQRGGYGLTLMCARSDQYIPDLDGRRRCPVVAVTEEQEMPYIAVETSM
jgi:hypothetical protein